MEFIELAKKRYSSRLYRKQPVEKELVYEILEAGRIAPSAANKQPWKFYAIMEPEMLSRIHACYPREWLKNAPVIIAACGDHNASWKRSSDGMDATFIDIAIAVDHMTLRAAELGLGTCWICAFDPFKIRHELSLPPHIEPIVLLPVGWPEDKPDMERHNTKRLKMEEIVTWL